MMNKQYWEERMINLLLMSEQSVLDYEKQLNELYTIALTEIKKDINSFYAQYAVKNKVPYSEAMRRLNTNELKDFHVMIKEYNRIAEELGINSRYRNYLKELGQRVRLSRLVSLETSIRQHIEVLKHKQHNTMTDLLDTNFLAQYYLGYLDIARGLETSVNFATIDQRAIETAIKNKWNGRNYSDSIWADKDKLVQTLNKTVPQAFSRGLSIKQISEEIQSTMNTSMNHARTLARTEVNYLANQADLSIYKEVGIEEYQILATLDLKTSEICRSMDGKIFKVSEAKVGINYPSFHPNCRTVTIVVTDDSFDGERAARDQEGNTIFVPRNTTQEQWINTYAPEEDRERLLRFLTRYKK